MTKKELESLADIVVGKVAMPGHAFADEGCDGSDPYACPGIYYPYCSSSDQVTCTPRVSCDADFYCDNYYLHDTCTGNYTGCAPTFSA